MYLSDRICEMICFTYTLLKGPGPKPSNGPGPGPTPKARHRTKLQKEEGETELACGPAHASEHKVIYVCIYIRL